MDKILAVFLISLGLAGLGNLVLYMEHGFGYEVVISVMAILTSLGSLYRLWTYESETPEERILEG